MGRDSAKFNTVLLTQSDLGTLKVNLRDTGQYKAGADSRLGKAVPS